MASQQVKAKKVSPKKDQVNEISTEELQRQLQEVNESNRKLKEELALKDQQLASAPSVKKTSLKTGTKNLLAFVNRHTSGIPKYNSRIAEIEKGKSAEKNPLYSLFKKMLEIETELKEQMNSIFEAYKEDLKIAAEDQAIMVDNRKKRSKHSEEEEEDGDAAEQKAEHEADVEHAEMMK